MRRLHLKLGACKRRNVAQAFPSPLASAERTQWTHNRLLSLFEAPPSYCALVGAHGASLRGYTAVRFRKQGPRKPTKGKFRRSLSQPAGLSRDFGSSDDKEAFGPPFSCARQTSKPLPRILQATP